MSHVLYIDKTRKYYLGQGLRKTVRMGPLRRSSVHAADEAAVRVDGSAGFSRAI